MQVVWSSDSEQGELKSLDASISAKSQSTIDNTENIALEIYTEIAHHITVDAIEQGIFSSLKIRNKE